MADETFTAEQRDSAVTAALNAERERVTALRKLAGAHNATDAELTAAIDGNVTVAAFAITLADNAEAAKAAKAAEIAAAETAAAEAATADEAKRLAALKTDEEVAAEAAISGGSEPTAKDDAAKLAAEIVASANLAAGKGN
jgi:hypothetical protein